MNIHKKASNWNILLAYIQKENKRRKIESDTVTKPARFHEYYQRQGFFVNSVKNDSFIGRSLAFRQFFVHQF